MKKLSKVIMVLVGLLNMTFSYSDCCDPNPSYGHCANQTVMQTCSKSGVTSYVLKANHGTGAVRPLTSTGNCPDCGHPGLSMTVDPSGNSTYYHSCNSSGFATPVITHISTGC